MLADFEKRLAEIQASSCFMPLDVLAVYDGVYDLGRQYKDIVGHFSLEMQTAAGMMHSKSESVRAGGMVRAREIAGALTDLLAGEDAYKFYNETERKI